MVLVEEGPWPEADLDTNLQRLQERLYNCIDAAIEGKIADQFPESRGRPISLQLDAYNLPQEVAEFFERFASGVLNLPQYAAALGQSTGVSGIGFKLNFKQI